MSIGTHDMTVIKESDIYRILTPFGKATMKVADACLYLSIETGQRASLNRLKHALGGPIGFIAASEKPKIEWSGDITGPVPLDDMRILRVTEVLDITPRMRRITFQGEDLSRFDRPDQLHCRVIFQPKGAKALEWPMMDDQGNVMWPENCKLPTRVYTIRSIDTVRGELAMEFCRHENAGPATQWAINATPGDIVAILGPAADGPRPASFYVLVGDETGLPAISRILEHLDDNSRGMAIIEVAAPSEERELKKPRGIAVRWLHRNGAEAGTTGLLRTAVQSIRWPTSLDEAFFWGGCEHNVFREIHDTIEKQVRLPCDRRVLYSHWHRHLSEEQIIAVGAEAYLP
ncbi:hypothetical protein RBB50_011379 [Rhinocladiella similis]